MENIDKRQLVVYAAAAIAIALIGARYLRETGAQNSGKPAVSSKPSVQISSPHSSKLIVHVAGAVRRPGVYSLPENSRVDDAILLAGGRRRNADLDALNLAAKVTDGQQIVMPARTSEQGAAADGEKRAVNLNQATPEELDQLDGIGPTMAAKIVEYRKQNGGFGSVSDLDKIAGIGEKRLASLKEQLNG